MSTTVFFCDICDRKSSDLELCCWTTNLLNFREQIQKQNYFPRQYGGEHQIWTNCMPSVDGACLGVQNLWETSGFLGAYVLRLKEKYHSIYKFSVEFIMNNILPVIFW